MFRTLFVIAALMLSSGASALAQSYLYGALVGDEGGKEKILSIDPITGAETVVCSFNSLAPSNVNSPNGLAYDAENNVMYFSVNTSTSGGQSQLWYCIPDADAPEQVPVRVGATTGLLLNYFSAGAAYYEGSYYYFRNDNAPSQEQLRALNLTTLVETAVATDFAPTTINFRGGDLAFLACSDEQTLYASSLASGTAIFFKLGLSPAGYTAITTALGDDPSSGDGYATAKQLAFAGVGDELVLFSHSTGTGWFGVVDTGLGTVTGAFQGSNFTDISSATSCQELVPPVINIKPYSWPNGLNACSNGATPVIIWGSATLDVTEIDQSTVVLGNNSVKSVGRDRLLCSIEDVGAPDLSPSCLNVEGCDGIDPNPDGYADLSCKLETYGMETSASGEVTTAELCFQVSGETVCVEQEIKLTCQP